jgi:hypothetical protein
MGEITYQGEAPYHLPNVQRATARAVNNAVEMTLHAVVLDQEPNPVPVRILVTWHVAQTLGHELVGAAMQAELNAGAN